MRKGLCRYWQTRNSHYWRNGISWRYSDRMAGWTYFYCNRSPLLTKSGRRRRRRRSSRRPSRWYLFVLHHQYAALSQTRRHPITRASSLFFFLLHSMSLYRFSDRTFSSLVVVPYLRTSFPADAELARSSHSHGLASAAAVWVRQLLQRCPPMLLLLK